MKKVLFIDRDGVINSDVGHYYIYKVEDFKINKGVIEGLRIVCDAGFEIVIVTNQGGVAKGEYTLDDVAKVHAYLQEELKKANIKVLGIYVCPHHSDVESCECRKPKPGMILKALRDFDIDKSQSFLIGDSVRDIQAGDAAGLQACFKVEPNTSIIPACLRIVELA